MRRTTTMIERKPCGKVERYRLSADIQLCQIGHLPRRVHQVVSERLHALTLLESTEVGVAGDALGLDVLERFDHEGLDVLGFAFDGFVVDPLDHAAVLHKNSRFRDLQDVPWVRA